MNSGEWSLVLKFPDASESFVNGFEAGMIWEKMQSADKRDINKTIEMTVHEANRELYEAMATKLGWSIKTRSTTVEGWIYLTLRRQVYRIK